jgi:excisionase family DNA binding protein
MNKPSSADPKPAVRQAVAALGPAGTKLAYTVEQAAGALGIGRTKLFAEIAAGRLRARKAGKRTLIAVEDARAFLANLPEMPHTA